MGLYIRGLSITFDMKFLIAFAFLVVAANAAVFQPQDPTVFGGWTPDSLKKPVIQKPAIIGGWTPDFLKKPVIQNPAIIGGWTPDFLKKPVQKPMIIGGWTPDFLKQKQMIKKPTIIGGWTPAPKCVPHVRILQHPVCVPVRHYCVPVQRCAPRVIRRSR